MKKKRRNKLEFFLTESSDYRCCIFDKYYITPEKGKEPNLFIRLMQTLLFGIKWEKIKKNKRNNKIKSYWRENEFRL